jgi:predicted nuclease of restriction endonuclease-like RecB superfamily
MLTGKMVRVRFARDRIIPYYLDVGGADWREVASRLLELFRGQEGRTRGELDEDQHEAFGDDPGQLVHQGLAKLLEDRCEFETVSGHPPEEIRAAVFRAATEQRGRDGATLSKFDRDAVLQGVSSELGLSPEELDRGLFADLKSEQRLVAFKDISPEHLLERYNVALAQAVLLRAVRVHVTVCGEPPQRYRQLLRRVKFHRLVCEIGRAGPNAHRLSLDGPLSLFSATQRYGLQLAMFLPAVLLCRDFDIKAEIRWGPQRKSKTFLVVPADGLVSHYADTGMYVPAELQMFVDLFRKRIVDWDLADETEAIPLGGSFWIPDFRLTHHETGKVVRMEVLGFWRRSSAEAHLGRLREHIREPFLLAVSDQLHIDESGLEGMPAGIHRFKNMPLPDEVARLASLLIGKKETS